MSTSLERRFMIFLKRNPNLKINLTSNVFYQFSFRISQVGNGLYDYLFIFLKDMLKSQANTKKQKLTSPSLINLNHMEPCEDFELQSNTF